MNIYVFVQTSLQLFYSAHTYVADKLRETQGPRTKRMCQRCASPRKTVKTSSTDQDFKNAQCAFTKDGARC